MIKKLIKNIILISLILNSLLCITFNTYIYFKNNSISNKISEKSINSTDMKIISIEVQEGINTYDFLDQQRILGQHLILSANFMISIFSLIIGIISSLVISLDDSKIIKYVLIFILFNICFNTILTSIFYGFDFYNFVFGYITILKEFFIIYTILYLLFICIKLLVAQLTIKNINTLLKNKKSQ